MINSHHEYFILSYLEEVEVLENLLNNHFNNKISEYSSIDRKVLSGLDYYIPPKTVRVSDVIEDLHNRSLSGEKDYTFEDMEQINYSISFTDSHEKIICDGSRAVLLYVNNNWIKSKISNLRPGDQVRIYNNLSKEKLFDIAAQEDKLGRFNNVDSDSKLWKTALRNHFFNRKAGYNEIEHLTELRNNGLTISPATIKKWLSIDDKERFPNSISNLIAIKITVNDSTLNERFESIKQSRRFYRGIMISLGRDLSDDVMEFIVSNGNNVGKVLSTFTHEEIKSFISNAAPIKIIKEISITEDDDSN